MKYLAPVVFILLLSCRTSFKQETALTREGLITKLDSVFSQAIKPNEPGAAVLIAVDGELVVGKGYGMRDVARGLSITDSTNLRMASVSKQFTALCVLTLADRDSLSLTDEAYEYLPYEIFKGISIENLLNHTSGLPDYYEYFASEWDTTQVLQNQDVLEWLATGPDRLFEPGTNWEYSNTAYLMLALIVEKVSGKEFSAFAKSEVFDKAGMANTHYFNLANPIEISERASCYEKNKAGKYEQVDGYFMNGVMGDGAVYTSIEDYFAYDQALRSKTILSDKMHELIFKPSSAYNRNGNEGYYAMGWNVTDTTASHSGGWFGTNTYVKRFLNKPVTFAIFMNRGTLWDDNLVEQTEALVIRHLKFRTEQQK